MAGKRPATDGPEQDLTPRQREIYQVIVNSVKKRGYAPSMREIGRLVNLTSPSSVKHQLEALEVKGYLRRDRRLPRAIEVVELTVPAVPVDSAANSAQQSEPRYVPLVGQIAAGLPILAEQLVDGLYPFPRELVGEGDVFMLKVQGDSMTGAAIEDGDYVLVRRQPTAENGQIVAAQLGDEATVKTLTIDRGKVWLTPRNPAYQPISAKSAKILGRVVCVVRSL
ncbi:MAG: transcriptional repressor LexA [Bifidobacteriaceae bacterium]|jgi:repressor LexA|nr:transcriptional repressor LexA [Bifidobacteriaceae bacterium]